MISVESLTKRYADTDAISGISFNVEKGEIVGLLGPNGAGKTTTMRVLTCFVPPTSGTAKVAGFDIYEQSVEVRRNVGYLPENVPMYGEMRVDEYLRFRARLKGVRRSALTGRLDYVMGRCGVAEVRTKIIDHLSKGYRQRVGLAEALLHDPPILILDEPTVGLDPNQIRQVRGLIQNLGHEHTIILSSHILPEVEQVCGRVVIINKGRIVAQDRTDVLRQEIGGAVRLEIEMKGPLTSVTDAIAALPGVRHVRRSEDLGTDRKDDAVQLSVDCAPGEDLREEVFRLAVARGWVLLGLSRPRRSLEDIFIDLTTAEVLAEAEGGPPSDAAGPPARRPDRQVAREAASGHRLGAGAAGQGGAGSPGTKETIGAAVDRSAPPSSGSAEGEGR